MSAPVIASPTASLRPAPKLFAFGLAAVITIAAIAGIVAVAASSPSSTSDASLVESQYGAGYPQHGGLAGPSRISVFDQYSTYGAGYPQHGGLAGPSRLATVEHPGYGVGYPLHGGLAGPSRADEGD